MLKQTANLYGSAQSASKSFTVLADALNAVGQSERQLFKQLNEACHSKYETFMKTTYSNFKKEKKVLDDKALDMDGAKDKNQKKPSNDNKVSVNFFSTRFRCSVYESFILSWKNKQRQMHTCNNEELVKAWSTKFRHTMQIKLLVWKPTAKLCWSTTKNAKNYYRMRLIKCETCYLFVLVVTY